MTRVGSADGWIGRWSPGIGDPTFGGWLTVLAYALTAFACWRVLAKRSLVAEPRERVVWRCLAWAVACLGLNKQLDLQSALTEIGRLVAYEGGWYGERRFVQALFILGVGVAGGALGLWLLRRAPATQRPTRLALLGFLGLVLFVVIRAASFHHFDRFIVGELFGLRFNWLLENGTLAVIAWGAHRRAREGRAPSSRTPVVRAVSVGSASPARKVPRRRS